MTEYDPEKRKEKAKRTHDEDVQKAIKRSEEFRVYAEELEKEARQKALEESTIELNKARTDFMEEQTWLLKEQSKYMFSQENRDVERLEIEVEREGRELKRDKRDNTIKWSTIVMAFATAIIAAGTILPYIALRPCSTHHPTASPTAPQVLSQATKSKEPSATTDTVVRKPLPPNRVP